MRRVATAAPRTGDEKMIDCLPCREPTDIGRGFIASLQKRTATQHYAKCVEVSKRVRWDIDRDVLRGRTFDAEHRLLPDALTQVDRLPFLDAAQRRLMSQVQGRTYANMFGLVERYITAKTIELGREHALGNQVAFEALIRFSDEELKHQELFRRIERLAADGMPHGYRFVPHPNEVAASVLAKSSWAVIAFTYQVELFTQAHYRCSMQSDPNVSELYQDVFFFHWKEESQHAIVDELEWRREDERLSHGARDAAVGDLIALVTEFDKALQAQALADVDYFRSVCGDPFAFDQRDEIARVVLDAYRWQYLLSGLRHPRFVEMFESLTSPSQRSRFETALTAVASRQPRAYVPV